MSPRVAEEQATATGRAAILCRTLETRGNRRRAEKLAPGRRSGRLGDDSDARDDANSPLLDLGGDWGKIVLDKAHGP